MPRVMPSLNPSLKVVATAAIASLALSACVVAPYPQRVYAPQPVPAGPAPAPAYGYGQDEVVVDVAHDSAASHELTGKPSVGFPSPPWRAERIRAPATRSLTR